MHLGRLQMDVVWKRVVVGRKPVVVRMLVGENLVG